MRQSSITEVLPHLYYSINSAFVQVHLLSNFNVSIRKVLKYQTTFSLFNILSLRLTLLTLSDAHIDTALKSAEPIHFRKKHKTGIQSDNTL